MGADTGERNVIVGVCDELVQTMLESGCLMPVAGAGNCYIPTPQGRTKIMALLKSEDSGEAA